MVKCALSITCPVLLGCQHSKIKSSSPTDYDGSRHQDNLVVKESRLGTEVIFSKKGNDSTDDSKTETHSSLTVYNDNKEVVEEEIVVSTAKRLNAAPNINNETLNTKSQSRLTKNNNNQIQIDPLEHLPPSLNRNWLNFPFLTDGTTYKYLSSGKTKIMFVMRGLSGSGKSSIVQTLKSVYPKAVVCSADNYFLSEDGEYNFDQDKLGNAHSFCQHLVKTTCENGDNIVIVDNTNVKRWEMKFYLDTAKRFGYISVLVEPKTDWKFNPHELFIKNTHGVPLEILQRKVQTYDHVIPLYYGWFVSHQKSDALYEFASQVFDECLDGLPEFRNLLMTELHINSKHTDQEVVKEILTDYYSSEGKRSPNLHCTACFCGGGKGSGSKEYHSRSDVQSSCGQAFQLQLTGLVMTAKTFGMRVSLDGEELKLITRPYEDGWTGMDSNLSVGESSISNGKKNKGRNDKMSKKQLKRLAKNNNNKKCLNTSASDTSLNFDYEDEEQGVEEVRNEISSNRGSLLDLMNKKIAEKNQFEESSSSENNVDLNSLCPCLQNDGFGRSAHLTLKTARSKNIDSKQTNFDVLFACDVETSRPSFNSSQFISVSKGKAIYYEEGLCCVYFEEPIKITSVFSGYY